MEKKTIQKKPKNRCTSAIRPTKGRKQQERRYEFQLLLQPDKYAKMPKLYHLYADLVLMQYEDTLCQEASLYNYYKVYKHIEIDKYPYQQVVRIQVESKESGFDDWKKVVDELRNSPLEKLRPWADLVKGYCERYEKMIKELEEKMSPEKIAEFDEISEKARVLRKTFVNTYPVVEYKSELRNGQIELTEVSYSEKYLTELGYTVSNFVNTVFQSGLPELLPLTAAGSSWIARMRLENFLKINGSYQTPESEHYVVKKDGSLRMVKFITHYFTTFENGVPGFIFYGVMTARPKPCSGPVNHVEKRRVSKDFANLSFEKEDNEADFLEMYYGDRE